MTTPVGPPDFPLDKDSKAARDAALKAYYAEHADRLKFVPDDLKDALGLS